MDSPPTSKEPQKRRACDECRTKKLACSKDLDGCRRCKKEGIQCIYSVQKPMGRPRKRAYHEVNGAEPVPELAPEPQAPTHDAHDLVGILPPFDSTLTMELDLSFLDFDNPNLNFFELMDPNLVSLPDLDGLPPPKKPNNALEAPILPPPSTSVLDATSNVWLSDFLATDIDFDIPASSSPYPDPDLTPAISRDDIEAIMSAEIPDGDKLPSLSPPDSHTTPSSSTSSPLSLPPPPCACLSTLYLALDSLQRLPTEVGAAMKVARTAARHAQSCIACETCGNPPLEYNHKPAIGPFQTLMMLGALLPSLSHAYMHILTMVDDAAAAAVAERRKMSFALDDYGGLWGGLESCIESCGADRMLREPLEPMMWRLLVRALLKIDVYGMQSGGGLEGGGSLGVGDQVGSWAAAGVECQQPGLKDIIATVEERSRRRHEQLDMALAAGLVERPADCDYDMGGEPPCMKIINIAKKSMKELIIP